MLSEIVDVHRLSPSSIFFEELHFPNERQIGFWKTEDMTGHRDGKLRTTGCISIALSPSASTMENQILVDSHIGRCFDIPNIYLTHGQQVNLCTEKHVIGVDKSSSTDMGIHLDHDSEKIYNLAAKPVSYITEGQNSNILGRQCENDFLSSSLSDLFSRKIILSSNDALHGHSVGGSASNYEDEKPFESVEELEAQTIGNLLPDDDDLLSGVTDGFDYVAQPNIKDEVEDLDFFSGVGGLDLGDDYYSLGQDNLDLSSGHLSGSNVALAREHPSRTLFVRNINTSVDNFELRALFEQYGDIHTLYTACKHRGFVMVSYYDLRAALKAMETLQNKPLKRRKLDIHFSIPKDNLSEKDINQGTLVISFIDSSVSNSELQEIFGIYGEIKEIRETPQNHKLIEFYDVRAAEGALCALSKSDVAGMGIKIEPSLHGDTMSLMQSASELVQDELSAYLRHSSSNNITMGLNVTASRRNITSCKMNFGTTVSEHTSTGAPISLYSNNPFHHGISSSVPSSLSSLVSEDPIDYQFSVADSGHSSSHLKFDLLNTTNFHPHLVPNYHDSLGGVVSYISEGNMATDISGSALERTEHPQFSRVGIKGHSVGLNGSVFCASGNACSATPAHHYGWNSSPKSQCRMWSNSASFVNGACSPHPSTGLHSFPRAPSHTLNTFLPINNHLVGSAPYVNPSHWDRKHAYAGEVPDASAFHPRSLGNMRISSNPLHPLEFVSHNIFPDAGGNCLDVPVPISSKGFHSPQQSLMFPRGEIYPVMSPFDSPNEHARRRRAEGSSSQADSKKQYELDIDRIMHQEDKRTTLMIKNIPNKYTSKMLLAAIDEGHRGTYDFLYLPIDFKNKCNVGYAFINMTDPSLIIPLYKAFNGKKWEKFNSEKVASLAYARIQGKAALIAHFQNSSLMNVDKRCRPILFHTDGPNAGDQVPFPMGANVHSREQTSWDK